MIAFGGLFFWGLSMAPSLTTATAAAKSRGSPKAFSPRPPATLTDEQLKVFAQALDIVEQQYAEPKTSKDLVYGAIQGAVGSLDPHSSFMTPDEFKELQVETEGKFSGIGLEMTLKDRKLIVVSPIEGTPAYRAGILAGDQIVKVDGTPTKNISIIDAVQKIRGPKGSQVTITINRQGFTKPQDYSIVRDIIPIHSVKARLIEGGYGFIRVSNFQDKPIGTCAIISRRCASNQIPIKGLVLDLRNDPGGLLDQAVMVADEFLNHGLIVKTEGRDPHQRMQFNAHPGDPGDWEPYLPVVVLINEGSASASEIVAGALERPAAGRHHGHQEFRQGLGADHPAPGGRFGPAPDHGPVLHPQRQDHP